MLVLPDEPVMPTTAIAGRRRTTSRASAAKASWVSATTTHGTPSTGRVTSAATAPRSTAAGDEVVPVGVLAAAGDEQPTRDPTRASR